MRIQARLEALGGAGIVAIAIGFSTLILWLGYVAFGAWTSLIFSSGFLGGLLLWWLFPGPPALAEVRTPYWITLALFLVHRVEERFSGFFAALSDLTGVPTPPILSWPVILLVLASVGAWLLVLPLLKRGSAFGAYLAWTFFTAMGVTELAHFVFPFVVDGRFGYFPGMASVVLLAPVAWWGMFRMARAQH